MTNALEKQRLVSEENLDQSCYFQSLLQEAHRLRMLTEAEMEQLQLQIVQLLAKQTGRYTDSSSVRVETAEGILQSILYTLGISLKSYPGPEAGLSVLKQKPLDDLHRQGRNLITARLGQAKQRLETVQTAAILTDNIAYNDTIREALPGFFKAYDSDFAAHDTPAMIDYPLNVDSPHLTGIEYIFNYLQTLQLENEFCSYFSPEDIRCLLRGCDEHYRDLLLNIFGLVLMNAIGCILAYKHPLRLNLGTQDRQLLAVRLESLSKPDLAKLLQDSSIQLCQELGISDRNLQAYIKQALSELPAKVAYALERGHPESIFISFKEDIPQPGLQFEDGAKLEDGLFRSIADEIRECRFVSDKISIIKREIHSLRDLVDIFEGYCIFDDEFSEVFQSLGDMELALLSKMLPAHVIDQSFSENEKEWQNKLTCFLSELDLTRRKKVLSEDINLAQG